MIGIIYKNTILIDKKFYIGQHCGESLGEYYGSGKIWSSCLNKLKRKFPTCWKKLIKREILYQGNCTQAALDKLEEIYIRREHALYVEGLGGCNILPGAAYGFNGVNPSKIEFCVNKSKAGIKKWWDNHPEAKEELSRRRKGIKSSEEVKSKISKSLIGKFSGERNPNYGKSASGETRRKMSESQIKRGKRKPHSEETKKKISESRKKYVGRLHPLYGSRFIWITNGIEDKRLKLGLEIPSGWIIGRSKVKKYEDKVT